MIVLQGAKGEVTHLAFNPSGALLAVSGGRRALELWDVTANNKWGRYANNLHFRDGPTHFHPTKPLCFAAASYGIAEIETDTKKARVTGVSKYPMQNQMGVTAMTADGSGFVCQLGGFYGRELLLLRWRENDLLQPGWKVEGSSQKGRTKLLLRPFSLAASPDGKSLFSIDSVQRQGMWVWKPGQVTIRRMKDGEMLSSADLPSGTTAAIAIAPDSRQFATFRNNKLTIWNAADLKAKPHEIKNDNRSRFTGVAYHPSGKYLAATSNDTTVKLYDTTTWNIANSFTWEIGMLRSVAFSPDGMLAAAGSATGKVVVWDVDL